MQFLKDLWLWNWFHAKIAYLFSDIFVSIFKDFPFTDHLSLEFVDISNLLYKFHYQFYLWIFIHSSFYVLISDSILNIRIIAGDIDPNIINNGKFMEKESFFFLAIGNRLFIIISFVQLTPLKFFIGFVNPISHFLTINIWLSIETWINIRIGIGIYMRTIFRIDFFLTYNMFQLYKIHSFQTTTIMTYIHNLQFSFDSNIPISNPLRIHKNNSIDLKHEGISFHIKVQSQLTNFLLYFMWFLDVLF